MSAELQRQVIRYRESPEIAALRRVEVVPQGKIDRVEIEDLRPARADAEAVDVAVAWRRDVPVLPILIREPKIIHHSGIDDAGHAQEILDDPVLVRDMVRGECGNAGREWAAVSVPVMRIAD